MEPVSNSSNLGKTGCNYQSTQCVIWEGPNLPCINLCKGDSIQDVVYKLATEVCNMADALTIDVTTIDFDCILEGDNTRPDNLQETIQALIYKACAPATVTPGSETTLPNVVLPDCLRYTDTEGDVVSTLPLDEYVLLFAGSFCNLVNTVDSIQVQLDSHEERIDVIETTLAGLGTPGTGTATVPTINPNCVTGTPGTAVDIDVAFEALEADYCSFKFSVGTPIEFATMLNSQCASLGGEDQLSNGSVQMEDLAGWQSTPNSVADSLTNAWLTICDMRAKLKDHLTTNAGTCILIPPASLEIGTLTSLSATINWTAHSLTGFDAPLGYTLTVFNYDAVTQTTTGAAIAGLGGTHPAGTLSQLLDVSALDYDKTYAVQLSASYDCGESQVVQVIGQLRACPVNFKLALQSDTEVSTVDPVACGGITPLTNKTRRLLVTLTDSTGTTVTNTKTTPITAILRLKVTDCNLANDVWEYFTVSIAPNGSTWSMIYDSQIHHTCISTGLCEPVIRGDGASSIQIDTFSHCDVVAGNILYI